MKMQWLLPLPRPMSSCMKELQLLQGFCNKLQTQVVNKVEKIFETRPHNLAEEKQRTVEGRLKKRGISLVANNIHAFSAQEKKISENTARLQATLSNMPNEKVCSIHDLTQDPFEDDHLKVGLFRFRFVVRWPWSLKTTNMDQLQNHMYIHGIWPEMIVEDILQQDNEKTKLELELDETLKQHMPDLLKYWPDLNNPTDVSACKRWVTKQWYRHGLPCGMRPHMFITYALALIQAFPHDFGITVGKPLMIGKASEQVREQLKNTVLFKEHIGADVYPEIFTVIDPNDAINALKILEVRLHFTQVLVDNKAKLRLMDAPIRYKGKCNDHLNMVIMPSNGSRFI